MEKSTLCRICLDKDVRMYDLVNTNLQETYEILTAMKLETKDSRPSQVCYICYAQLQTCQKLRSKSLQSEELFSRVLDSNEHKLTPLHIVTPLLTIQLLTHLSIPPVIDDDDDDDDDDGNDDNPSSDASNAIDNVQVKTKNVEGTKDMFDISKVKVEFDSDVNNISETEDTVLPCHNNRERGILVDSRDDVCGKNVKIEWLSIELSNFGTSVPAPMQLKLAEQENKTQSGGEGVNDSSEVYINKTEYLPSHKHTDSKERPYKCDICGERFKRSEHLLRHSYVHTGIKAFGCDICGNYFITKALLATHIRIHTGIKPYGCNNCGKCFNLKDQLKKHICIHGKEKLYKCDTCGKCFVRSNSLLRHNYICAIQKLSKSDICETGSITTRETCFCRERLQKHITTPTKEKPYKCHGCGKCFATVEYLLKHITIHTDIKVFHCNSCGKSFRLRQQLNAHISIHTKEKPYKCDICGKCFARKDYLRKHNRRHRS